MIKILDPAHTGLEFDLFVTSSPSSRVANVIDVLALPILKAFNFPNQVEG